MNINELNRIKTINIDAEVEGTQRNSGTFKEILENVMRGIIIPLTDHSGRIIGMSFDTKSDNIVKDCIEQRKFEIRYCCKPVMSWVLKSLQLKADGKVIAEVIENNEGISVVTNTGEVIEIETYYIPTSNTTYRENLPGEVEISYNEAEEHNIDNNAAVIAYLREKYNHYLSGKHEAPTIEFDAENEVIKVTNIHWGRKR